MHFAGQQTVHVPREAVWTYLMDPHAVADCAPGFQGMQVLSPEEFKPTLGIGIGAVKATFTLDVHLMDLREPEHIAMTGHGVAAGSATDLRAAMDLVMESEAVTARLLESTANKLTGRFFDCLRKKLEASAVPSAGASSGEAP